MLKMPLCNGVRLDPRDIQILLVLQQDARIRLGELAKRIRLSITPTWQRVKRLETAGFIAGYHARIDIMRLAINTTNIYATISLEEHRAVAVRKFESAVVRVPEITSCHAIAGGCDYMVRLLVRNIAHYQEVMDALLEASLGIKEYCTYIVMKDIKDEHTYSAAIISAAQAATDGGGH